MKPGTIKVNGRYFWITCPPQIAQKLVPIFTGCKRSADRNAVVVMITDENAATLEWCRLRFPLEPEDENAATALASGKDRHDARMASIEATRATDYTPPAFDLALPARPYQAAAADLLQRSTGLLLADDVGLGKTVSAIASMVLAGALPVVVVTLTHLCRQWEREVKRFAPALRVHIVDKMQPYPLADTALTAVNPETGRRRIVKNGARALPDVVVLNYHKLDSWRDALVALSPGLVIWDEVQELRKGEKSKKGGAAYALAHSTRLRLGLSATPIYNYGAEIHNVMEAIRPGVLGDREAFLAEWCTGGGDKAKLKEPEVMRGHLVEVGAMLRRRRKDVNRELPKLERLWMPVDTDHRRLKEISDTVAELARTVVSVGGTGFSKMQAAGELSWQLRQATGLAKAAGVLDLVRLIIDGDESGDERVLLYGHHHLVFDAWASGLERAGIKYARFTGKESANAKDQAVRAFTRGDARVMMMAVRSGAGIDGLQHTCRNVVFGELDWSPGVHIQAEGRIHRDGQPDPVAAYYPISEEGSDPVLQEVLGLKESQRAGLVDGDLGGGSEIDGADMDRIKRLALAYLEKLST